MRFPSHHAAVLEAKTASRRLWARLKSQTKSWIKSWTKNLSWQSRYTQAQYGHGSVLARRVAVDLALLGGAALIPLAVFFWSAESEQQQLARMPMESARYVEGWKMSQTQSHVFFDTPTQASQRWSIRCG